MNRTIVIAFSTLDGVMEDPDGREGTAHGGWAFRHGPEAVAGDKFKLGPILDSGVLLMGHKTWRAFSKLWPNRTDDFSATMNRIPKLVVSHGTPDLNAWANSSVLTGDLAKATGKAKAEHDVVVLGSASVVHVLAAQNLIDEYRILVFPDIVGRGTRLFGEQTVPTHLRLISAETAGPAVLIRYEQDGA